MTKMARRSREGFDPCGCWSLKDGSITIAIWTFICAALQIGLFGWQINVVGFEKERSQNSRAQWYGTLSRYDYRYPAYYEQYYQTPEEIFYLTLFIVQILHIVADFFLLGAACSLIWGINKQSRYLVWPYFPACICAMACSVAYVAVWISSPSAPSDAHSLATIRSVRDRLTYWSVLAALMGLALIANIYCFIIIVFAYRQMKRGTLKASGYYLEERSAKKPLQQIGADQQSVVFPEKFLPYYDNPLNASMRSLTSKPQIHVAPPVIQPQFTTNVGAPPPFYAPPVPAPMEQKLPPYRPSQETDNQSVSKTEFTKYWLQSVEPGKPVYHPLQVLAPTADLLNASKERRDERRRARSLDGRSRRSHRSHRSRRSSRSHGTRTSHSHSRRRHRRRHSDSSDDDSQTYSRSHTTRRSCRSCNGTGTDRSYSTRSRSRRRSRHRSTSSSRSGSSTGSYTHTPSYSDMRSDHRDRRPAKKKVAPLQHPGGVTTSGDEGPSRGSKKTQYTTVV